MIKWFGLLEALCIVLADQVSKHLITDHFILGEEREIISGCFNLVFGLNKGAAFGILNRQDIHWQTTAFLITTSLAVLIILVLIIKANSRQILYILGLGAILGGAIGNLIDRARIGYVIDFLDFHLGPYHWPAFNLADTFICIGGGCLIIHFIYLERKNHASFIDPDRPS